MASKPDRSSEDPSTTTITAASTGRPATSFVDDAPAGGEGTLGITLGLFAAGAFYLFAWAVPLAPIQRYFLGHPVAVAATVLFAVALAILLVKAIRISAARRLTEELRDEDLVPALPAGQSSAQQWLAKHDAGRVAKAWMQSIGELPQAAKRSPLVVRLNELLQRQSGRTSTRHLSDDLREISARESDSAHDSLQLVRIIVWAIPMLGFLGTVIGITQTLGGLDFSDGTAAVDRLKSGLYVAFDTTALGLVLSVLAIFLQFPVERGEQRLLGEIDRRVGALLAAHLPSDDVADNPAAHIAQLCEGIRVAVGESLASQTELWRTTIDEAHHHWKTIADENGRRIGEALTQSLGPLLAGHGQALENHSLSLRDHAESLQEIREHWNTDLQQRWTLWNEEYSRGAELLISHHESLREQGTLLVKQTDGLAEHSTQLTEATRALTDIGERAEQLSQLQRVLDTGLLRLTEVNAAVQHSLQARKQAQAADEMPARLSEAMLVLARAVDILGRNLPAKQASAGRAARDADESRTATQRRAA